MFRFPMAKTTANQTTVLSKMALAISITGKLQTKFINFILYYIWFRSQAEPTKGWDVFVAPPPEDEDETLSSKWIEKILRMLKLFTYIITFLIVLFCAVLSKSIVLFMTSMVRSNRTVSVCAQSIPGLERDKKYIAVFQADDPERISWIWSLFIVLVIPELMTLCRSARICIFKSYRIPSKLTFFTVNNLGNIYSEQFYLPLLS